MTSKETSGETLGEKDIRKGVTKDPTTYDPRFPKILSVRYAASAKNEVSFGRFIVQLAPTRHRHHGAIDTGVFDVGHVAHLVLEALRCNGSLYEFTILNDDIFDEDKARLAEAYSRRNVRVPKLLAASTTDERLVPSLFVAATQARRLAPTNLLIGLLHTVDPWCDGRNQ